MPGSRLLKRYSPPAFVWVVIFTFVASLTESTVALGTTAPEESTTVPTKSPLIACPKVMAVGRLSSASSAKNRTTTFMQFSWKQKLIKLNESRMRTPVWIQSRPRFIVHAKFPLLWLCFQLLASYRRELDTVFNGINGIM